MADDRLQREYGEDRPGVVSQGLKLGAMIGGGALAYKNRRFIGQQARRLGGGLKDGVGHVAGAGYSNLMRGVTGNNQIMSTLGRYQRFGRAVSEGLGEKAGAIQSIRSLANPKRTGYESRFNASLERQLKAKADERMNPVHQNATKMSQFYFNNKHMKQKEVKQQAFGVVQHRELMKSLQKQFPDQKDLGQMLTRYSKHNGSALMSNPTVDRAIEFVREFTGREALKKYDSQLRFKDESHAQEFTEKLLGTLEKHKNRSQPTMRKHRNEIKQIEENIEKIKLKAFEETFRKENNQTIEARLLAKDGYRHVTFAEHRKLNRQIDDMEVPVKGGKKKQENMIDIVQKEYGDKIKLDDLIVDPHLFMNDKGHILDTRKAAKESFNALSYMQDSFQIPFLRFNFLDLAHFTTVRNIKEMPEMGFLNPGEIHGFVQHNLKTFSRNIDKKNAGATFQPLSEGGYMYANGTLYDVRNMNVLDKDVYFGSSQFGPLARMHKGMGNLKEKEAAERGRIKKAFDLGGQEADSFWESTKGAIMKLHDPDYGPNIQNSMKEAMNLPPEERNAELSRLYKRLSGSMEKNSMSLSPEVADYMAGAMNDGFLRAGMNIDVRELNRDKKIMDALGEIVQKTKAPGNPNVYYKDLARDGKEADGIVTQIHDTWNQYVKDPHGFLTTRDMEPDKSIALPDHISPMQLHEPNLVAKTERVKRLVHQYAMKQMEVGTQETRYAEKLVKQGFLDGVLQREDMHNVRQLDTLSKVRDYHARVHSGDGEIAEEALLDFTKEATQNKLFADNIQHTMREFEPWYASAMDDLGGSITGSNVTVYRKHKSYRNRLAEVNEKYRAQGRADDVLSSISANVESSWGVARELFAGRKNASEVTTMTAFPYYYGERLDNAVSGLGLGLSQENRGSFLSIMGNQFGRRIVLPYVAYQQAMWLDGQFNDAFSNSAADMYVNMHSTLAGIKEFTGINAVMRPWSRVFAGSDQIAELPFVKPFNFATFGMFSDWRSEDDVEKYYESGEDPIRKSRYWGVGSSTPWAGGGIEYFQPNWYRRMKSDYKFTDTMYGSESEYWANHWMPTLTHPFAPIKHFLTDPYHYEDKHKKDRPYAVTGGFSEIQQIPLIGPALDGTVGRILKPRQDHPGLEKAHREYIEQLNSNIKAKYNELADGSFVQRGVAGGVTLLESPKVTLADQATTEESQDIERLAGGSDDGGGFSGVSTNGTVSGGIQVAGVSGSTSGGGSGITISSLAMMDLENRNRLVAAGATGQPNMPIDRYNKLFDPDVVTDFSDIERVDSAAGIARDAFYSASEIGGMYGFLLKESIGFEESGRGQTWAPSTLMTSYSRAFWDMNLGGLGGQLSEIGRRYVPRDPNKNYYSPIRNTMPDWMPDQNYFIDFQHGDPYTKVKKGEMRLPGKAYETLYQLHPDGTGEGEWAGYGAFDRMRILADVAPYGQEYKNAKKMVSKMNAEGLLTPEMKEEYDTIREQVSARKEKYRWYAKRFTNADIKEEKVTVTKVIDQNTFLTKEHPNNPIRLAGVKLSQDDEEAVNWLSQFIKEGAELKIGIDGDPVQRVKRDTMNTMHAVVYAPHGEEGGSWTYSIKGQSLNYILANREWSDGSSVKVSDDEGSVATYALFTKDMRAVGKTWETLTHDVLPQLPIVGVFADKFLQVRSAAESYEREQVYGKQWRPWTEPWKGWMEPMIDTIVSRNPLIAAAEGAGIGHLFTKGAAKPKGRAVGAIIAGGLASARVFYERADGIIGADPSAWLPERRRKEREINEYFDRLKYVKYRGLYERAKLMAKQKEGIDVEAFFDESRDKGDANKGFRRYFHEKKKWLSLAKKSGYGDDAAIDAQLDEISKYSKDIEADKQVGHVGPYAALAMQYRKEYESTLYGLDPKTSDMRDVLRALTPKDKEYLPEFLKSNNAKERRRILELVPNDMRRILQAKWGMDVDKKEDIASYFRGHSLPGASWEGWSPNVSLDNYKVKVMQNQGVELTEAGFWDDDVQRAENAGAEAIPMHSISSKVDVFRLQEVLRGAGLKDVQVSMTVGQGNGKNHINTVFDIVNDITDDIKNELNNNLHRILGGN